MSLPPPTWMPQGIGGWACWPHEFILEYQKGADNGVADALSQVPIHHNCETVRSLLEGARVGAADRGEAEASKELLCEHVCPENEVRVQAVKLAPCT